MTRCVHFLGGQGLLQVCGGVSASLADVHCGKSELLIAACSKLGNDDVWWAPSGVLGPWLMFTVGSQSCLLLLVVSSATMTCGGLRQVSLLCKWVA
jgi:hypothetical protein